MLSKKGWVGHTRQRAKWESEVAPCHMHRIRGGFPTLRFDLRSKMRGSVLATLIHEGRGRSAR